MVTIVKNSGEKLRTRMTRRGYSDEECKRVLETKPQVVILKKRSFISNSLKDSSYQSC